MFLKKFVKFMLNSYEHASRNKRELSVVKSFGCEIIVHTIGMNESILTEDNVTIMQYSKKYSHISIIRKLQILYDWFIKKPIYLKRQNADCISCHDLIALCIGWVSTWFLPKEIRPHLIYDSHEYEIGRNTHGKRGRLKLWFIMKIEKFLIQKCTFSIMVNDSIADAVQKKYNLKVKPIVVRNVTHNWILNPEKSLIIRRNFCEQMNLLENTFFIMYHGMITKGRGIEKLIEVVKINPSIALIIMGYGDSEYIINLKEKTKGFNIEKRVLFHSAVSYDLLKDYVSAVDCGMITIQNVGESDYMMLPNKFFENVQSLTPVIVSNFPEISSIVNFFDIGICVDPEDVNMINNAIEKMRIDRTLYTKYKRNLQIAKEQLCWENERKILENAYAKIFRQEI